MAATDATPFPIKNQAYRVTFPIFDNDGDLVTGAAALDSEVSIDGGTFADVTAEATEIATASGLYYLDLTAAEMNGDTISIIVKTTTTDAKTTPIVLYPVTLGTAAIGVNVESFGELGGFFSGGRPEVDINAIGNNAITANAINDGAISIAKFHSNVGSTTYAANPLAIAANRALTNQKLDKLLNDSVIGADVTDDSIFAKLVSDGVTADWDDFSNQLDSLVSIKLAIDALPDATAINAQVDQALADIHLDHLLAASVADEVVDNSVIAKLASATGDWSTHTASTDSMEALRDRGDSAWITGGGGGITDILNIVPNLPTTVDLANTATVRLGLMLVNSLDDLPSTAEITPGTISIDRKAIGGTSWTSVVADGACSEAAGLIYFDEVFDSGTGYAEGDSLRFTFKSAKITVSANDYDVMDATGRMFYAEVRQTMRGTDSAYTGTPPTVGQITADIDSNSTVLASLIASVGAFTGTGVNTVLGFFQALMRDDATTPSDVGGTYDDASHSLQAIAGAGGGGAPTSEQNATAVWDKLRSAHTTPGSFGEHTGDAAMRGTDSANTTTPPTTTQIRDAVTGGAYALDTDGSGRVRIVDGVGAGELNTTAGNVNVADKTGFSLAVTPPTATEITTDIDSNSTQLAKLGTPVANLAADVAAVKAQTDLIAAIKAITDVVPDSGAMTSIAQGSAVSAVASDISTILTSTGTTIPDAITALNNITVADILAGTIEGSVDVQDALKVILAAAAGKSSEHQLGTPKYRDQADTLDRISATTDANGNRTAVTLNVT